MNDGWPTDPNHPVQQASLEGDRIMPLIIVDGPTIAAGESLSDGVDCSAGEIVRITVPPGVHARQPDLSGLSDGNFYNDLFSSNGEEITVVAKGSTGIVVPEPGPNRSTSSSSDRARATIRWRRASIADLQ